MIGPLCGCRTKPDLASSKLLVYLDEQTNSNFFANELFKNNEYLVSIPSQHQNKSLPHKNKSFCMYYVTQLACLL